MRFIAVFALLLGAATVSGCQTTGAPEPSGRDVRLAKEIATSHCAIRHYGSPVADNVERMKYNDVRVHSITKRDNGWKAADITIEGIRDNIYFRPADGGFICGYRGWGKYLDDPSTGYNKTRLISPKQPSPTAVRSNLPYRMPRMLDLRRITIDWEGAEERLTGAASLKQNGYGGEFDIMLNDYRGKCHGSFSLRAEDIGSWKIECDNGLRASGKFFAKGRGLGSKGIGLDAQGRKISYIISAKTWKPERVGGRI